MCPQKELSVTPECCLLYSSLYIPICLYLPSLKYPWGELDRWSRGEEHLLFFRRTQLWFPASTMQITTICNFLPRRFASFFWIPWVTGMYMGYRHVWSQNTFTHKKLKNLSVRDSIGLMNHNDKMIVCVQNNVSIYMLLLCLSSTSTLSSSLCRSIKPRPKNLWQILIILFLCTFHSSVLLKMPFTKGTFSSLSGWKRKCTSNMTGNYPCNLVLSQPMCAGEMTRWLRVCYAITNDSGFNSAPSTVPTLGSS